MSQNSEGNAQEESTAGTDGKNDIIVRIHPGKKGSGLVFEIYGKGESLFREEMETSARKILEELGVTDAVVEMMDNWALDFTVRARVRAAALKYLGRES